MKRIDTLTPGTYVILAFTEWSNHKRYEFAKFIGITGAGDDREATFESYDTDKPYEWNAYRFQGRWTYGTSAQRLSLDSLAERLNLPNVSRMHKILHDHELEAYYVPNEAHGLVLDIRKVCCSPVGLAGEVFDTANWEMADILSSLKA